jgi:hypothetical protein
MEFVLCLELRDFGVEFELDFFFLAYMCVLDLMRSFGYIYIYIVGHLVMH